MIKNTNVRGASVTPEQEEKLFVQMRQSGAMAESGYRSMSGADVAGAEIHYIVRRVYVLFWEGVEREAAIAEGERQWIAYATENNVKVNAAPKTKRGPYQGASVIHYRWTDPGRWSSTGMHLRAMHKIIFGE